MIPTMNKKQFLITFFLLIPATTIAMKRSYSNFESNQLTIIEALNKERDEFVQPDSHPLVSIPYFQENHCFINQNCQDQDVLEQYKNFRQNDTSFLGIVACSIQVYKFDKVRESETQASFLQKKEAIKSLLSLGFVPTDKDKQYALLEKYNRVKPFMGVIYAYLCCYYDHSSILSELPKELINSIALCVFDTEESLF